MKPKPIIIPAETLDSWVCRSPFEYSEEHWAYERYIANKAAEYAAQKQLEATYQWFQDFYINESWMARDLKQFRSAMSVESMTLKEKAKFSYACLTSVDETGSHEQLSEWWKTIREAIDALPD